MRPLERRAAPVALKGLLGFSVGSHTDPFLFLHTKPPLLDLQDLCERPDPADPARLAEVSESSG